MKNTDIYYAINEIDDELVEEASRRHHIVSLGSFAPAAAAAALALTVGAVGVIGYMKLPRNPSSSVSAVIPDTSASSPEASSPEESSAPTTASESEPTTNDSDGIPATTLTDIPLSYWINSPDVKWSDTDIKTTPWTVDVPHGTVLISDELKALFADSDDSTFYMVKVDFSPSSTSDERDSFGNIGELKQQIEALTASGVTTNITHGSSEQEVVHEGHETSDEEKYKKLTQELSQMKILWYNNNVGLYTETFADNGMAVYADPWEAESVCFFTVATRSMIEDFSCKPTEAFIFYPAANIKGA